MTMIKQTWMVACKNHFGLAPGQKLAEFAAEIKALTADDKADLINDFKAIGIEVIANAK